jgi:hypothetical protein
MRFLTVKESPQTKLFVANGLPGGHGQNYESGGQEFESLRARDSNQALAANHRLKAKK